jgi:hypothetical protein
MVIDIPNIIKKVVVDTSARMGNPTFDAQQHKNDITFIDGHWDYITNWITKQDAVPKIPDYKRLKYPLIALVHDFEIVYPGGDAYPTTELIILIANSSKKEWSSEQRRTESYNRVIHPIYEAFIEEISTSKYFTKSKPPHTLQDAYHMQSDESRKEYKLSDIVDASFIKNLKLTLNPIHCSNSISSNNLLTNKII